MNKNTFVKLFFFMLFHDLGGSTQTYYEFFDPPFSHINGNHEKVGIVFLHGLGGSAESCNEWIDFARNEGIRPSSSQCAVYIPEAKDRSWFDVNALLPDLMHISNPKNQTPANIKTLLEKIKNIAPQLQSLKAGIKDFMKREGITMKNLHFVGYSQGGILAQMLAYSLPDSCGSVCFAGCPWVWTPGEDIKLPHSILMAINNDDPIFGNIYHFSRDIFKKKVGSKKFNTAVKEVIEQEGGHSISQTAKIVCAKHFKEILGVIS
ncbi:MAG: hypothetical protein WCJ92_01745 [Alphaproteobacteria bacterium]